MEFYLFFGKNYNSYADVQPSERLAIIRILKAQLKASLKALEHLCTMVLGII